MAVKELLSVKQESQPTRGIFQQLDRCAAWPYSRGEYVRRLVWEWVQRLLIRPSPRRAFGWRRFWLRCFGAKVHPTSRTRPSTRVFHPWLLTMGAHSSLGDEVNVYNLGTLVIGEHTVVSQHAHLCGGTHDHTKPELPLVRASITLGSGVWVCADAYIGPNVTVGDNTIVAARAVVVKDVQPNVIVAGNPARVIRPRQDVSRQRDESHRGNV